MVIVANITITIITIIVCVSLALPSPRLLVVEPRDVYT